MAGKKTSTGNPRITIQSVMGGEITVDEIVKRVDRVVEDGSVTNIYIKAEDNKAYYVSNRRRGSVLLWH